jgi:hypothetical protein
VHLPNHEFFAAFNAEPENGLYRVAHVAGAEVYGIAL